MGMGKCLARALLMTLTGLVLAGCSDGGDDNNPVMNPPPPPPNTTAVSADLTAAEVVAGSTETGTATADFTINLDDDTISGTVTLTGITADAVSINVGYAGEVGPELIALVENSATEWALPASAAFTAGDLADLESGRLYVLVTTAGAPDGALRAQLVVGNIQVLFAEMTGDKEVPPVASAGSAKAAITYDPDTGDIVVHVNATGLDDAVASHVHTALAGLTGGVTIGLVQDAGDVGHWFSEDAMLTADQSVDYHTGRLYLNLHTPAHQAGEVRAQIVPPGVEVVYTDLTAGEVVPPSAVAETGIAASTIVGAERDLSVNVYVGGPADTDAVAIHQAPAGQNGPVVYDLVQDPMNLAIWSMSDADVDESAFAALVNQGLYVQTASPGFSDGALRGQIETTMSDVPPAEAFMVASLFPPDGATINQMPVEVTVTFNRDVLAGSVSVAQFELLAAGGDGSFGDGNELAVNIAATGVTGTEVALDLTGAMAANDLYRLTVNGGSDGITDTTGVLLDGDADGTPGGDFVGSFTVNTAPTFGQVQAVFTASCALSGCHAGATPQEGMDLSAGQAYAAIVNVPSNQMPALDRIEPNDPDNSYLVRKIEGTGLLQRMPAGGPALPDATIQLIRDWVSAGTPNNPEVPDAGGIY
ncbi:MAG: CHRD domain-containing protein [Pseudomonadales bacterium]